MSLVLPPLRPTFEAALRDVTARDPRSRVAAAEVLADADEPLKEEACEGLRRLADDEVPEVRISALVGLGRHRDTSSLDLVLARFSDGDPTVREVAILAAGDMGDARAEPAIKKALTDARPEVRFQAIGALLALSKDDARVHLLARLRDDDAKVRAQAAAALSTLPADPKTTDALARLLEDADRGARLEAALALADLKDARAIPVLRSVGLSDDTRMLDSIVALADVHATEAIEDLAKIATAFLKHLMIKAAAAASLVRLGDPRGVRVLREVLRAFRADGRTYAVECVGELALVELEAEIVRLSERSRGADPVAVARTLVRLTEAGSAPAKQALERVAKRDDEAGEFAREALAARRT